LAATYSSQQDPSSLFGERVSFFHHNPFSLPQLDLSMLIIQFGLVQPFRLSDRQSKTAAFVSTNIKPKGLSSSVQDCQGEFVREAKTMIERRLGTDPLLHVKLLHDNGFLPA